MEATVRAAGNLLLSVGKFATGPDLDIGYIAPQQGEPDHIKNKNENQLTGTIICMRSMST